MCEEQYLDRASKLQIMYQRMLLNLPQNTVRTEKKKKKKNLFVKFTTITITTEKKIH